MAISFARAKNRRQTRRVREESATGGFRDYTLLFIVLFLLAFGLVMLYSTSSYEAAIKYNDGAYWLKRQLFATVLGLFFMFVTSLVPYALWKRGALILYLIATGLIFLIIPLGREVNGAKRWLYFHGLSIQPAEIAKIATIVATAVLIERLGRQLKTWKGLFTAMAPSLFLGGMLYFITRNLSSAIIVVAIAAGMVFVACPDYKRFVLGAAAVLAAAGAYVFYVVSNADNADSMEFRGRRILAWLDPQAYAEGSAFQTLQGLYAIGSGGTFGKGLGQSMQKLGYIPEAQNDMIFSIICEELGIFGAIGILIMFLMLLWRFLAIANNSRDLFGGLVVTGVLTHIAVQVVLNIAVVTNTIPNTGVTLPFISYGGTSVLFLLIEVGLCMSVARGIKLKDLQ